MILNVFKNFKGFELLDSGDGYRLERWGETILQRPDPQIIWEKSLPESQWKKASAIFSGTSGSDKGRWEIINPIPKNWIAEFEDVKFSLKLSPFKHTGIFAEQAANWEWMLGRVMSHESGVMNKSKLIPPNSKLKVLNLFAYTGGASIVLAKAGATVTHVDASKPAITWANENAKLNSLPKESIRWILDDCAKFVKRELKRGSKYEGIIMDPPAFGHSPDGKTWKFNDDLPGLLSDCINLLSGDAKFLLINGYATNSSALALNNLLEDKAKNIGGKIEFGELCLKQKNSPGASSGAGRKLSTGIFARWSA